MSRAKGRLDWTNQGGGGMKGADVRAFIAANGVVTLPIDDLNADDLPHIRWSGNPAHMRSVALKLQAVVGGEIDYLAVRAPDGSPIAKCLIDYSASSSEAEIAQLAVRSDLQGLGIATHLIHVAEGRIQDRGRRWAVLGVERRDRGVCALYERLGYEMFGQKNGSWEVEDDAGRVSMHQAELLLLRREVAR